MVPPVRHDPLTALDQVLMRYEDLAAPLHGDDDGYDRHPLPMAEFLRGMARCGEPSRFLDLGCGVGTKLAVASYLGWEVTGVERHEDYAAAARRIAPEATVWVGDAWSPPLDLRDFDVVYSYRLVVDLERQHALNRSIVARMRPGALYFCAGSDPVGLEEVGDGVWQVS